MLKTEFIFVPKVDCKIFYKIKETSVLLKGVQIKTLVLNVCFAHISASIHRIFKILVSIPHNLGYTIFKNFKNFKDPMYRG